MWEIAQIERNPQYDLLLSIVCYRLRGAAQSGCMPHSDV